MEYNDFYTTLDKELKQTDEGDDDSIYKFLNLDMGIDYTNETIKELVELNPVHWIKEETFYFNGDTTYFEIPAIWHKIMSYYNATDSAWRIPAASNDMYADVRAVSSRTLYFKTVKAKGDSTLFRASVYPPDIIQGSDTVPFPIQHMRFLRMSIIAKVLGRAGKYWNELMQGEYLRKEHSFKMYGNDVKRGTRVSGRGAGFGC